MQWNNHGTRSGGGDAEGAETCAAPVDNQRPRRQNGADAATPDGIADEERQSQE